MEQASPTPKHHPHPNYVAVFVWLTLFTVIEISLSFLGLPDVIRISALIGIAIVKATLVVLYYMHLRYDSKWYALILIVGIGFALLIGRLLVAIIK